jgi:glutaminase
MTGVAIPTHELQTLIDTLHAKYASNDTGEATYIPALGKAKPAHFGISLISTDGRTFEAGDCDVPFTIRSISKPFAFGLAVEEIGADEVLRRVSVELSGDAFNSIELQNGSNRPFNPMINTGVIPVSALLHSIHGDRTFDHLLERFNAIAGRSSRWTTRCTNRSAVPVTATGPSPTSS